MQWHLDEISALVTPGAHAVLIIDRAGWHTTGRLEIPSNITLMFLPPRAPELNPVENIWQFMRDNWLSATGYSRPTTISSRCVAKPGNRLIGSTLEDHVDRTPKMGPWVLINARWYNISILCDSSHGTIAASWVGRNSNPNEPPEESCRTRRRVPAIRDNPKQCRRCRPARNTARATVGRPHRVRAAKTSCRNRRSNIRQFQKRFSPLRRRNSIRSG